VLEYEELEKNLNSLPNELEGQENVASLQSNKIEILNRFPDNISFKIMNYL
jgi:hypothetical protein